MKNNLLKISFILSIGLAIQCSSQDVKISNKEDLFNNCMETFEDEEKCSSFLKKSEQDLLTEQEIKRKQRDELTTEQLDGLKLRGDIKGALQSKNKKFVISYLGEPDDTHSGGDQRDYLIYNRPISKYAPGSDPDDQITVIIRRGKVDRVNHVPPEGVETGFSISKLIQNRERRINSEKKESEAAPEE
ncbi:MAG: hypothetical protein GW938_08540 [Leptospira sp.]|nr:hypothetical protein [Leptospira sp.]NCS95038.1 hypothetical protein [Leptospira sp.]